MKPILIVDDSADDRDLLELLLRPLGLPLLVTECGNTAFEIMQQQAVSLVITDYSMPNGDGLWLLSKIQKQFIEVPVVLVTAEKSLDQQLVKGLGAYEFFSKPFCPERLLQIVSSVV
jgi:CheY-like chemotaxis protein